MEILVSLLFWGLGCALELDCFSGLGNFLFLFALLDFGCSLLLVIGRSLVRFIQDSKASFSSFVLIFS
jgi:hypothetical protein